MNRIVTIFLCQFAGFYRLTGILSYFNFSVFFCLFRCGTPVSAFYIALYKFGYSHIGERKQFDAIEAAKRLETTPLLVVADNNDPTQIQGHAWVMDGYLSYKEEWDAIDNPTHTLYYNLFHCVWGWGGKNNGYFKCPNSQTIGTTPFQYDDDDLKENGGSNNTYVNLEYWSNFKPIK